MVRFLASLIGAAFVFVLGIALWGSVSGIITDPAAPTAEDHFYHHPIEDVHFQSDGMFGTYNQQQLQRGFQVYKEVCSACHSLRHVAFRDLAGLGYNEAQVKALARDWATEQPSTNADTGENATRKNVPSDHFPLVFANDTAARAANGGAVPPDLSLMAKARHDGTHYIYSLVGHGYVPQPAALLRDFPDARTPTGRYYNQYFPNLNIAMPPPLRSEGQVQYADGTRPTVDQMAKDVAAFLTWAAEPRLETRHAAGFGALIFILIFCFLAWGAYQNVWRDLKH
ncbi:cytochrome c1 [Sphingomonas sp.]|uniref:cytochrome c1 n=1 Tax=Sphingomonas sp. TaxID=28214 RepID=UPI003CC5FBE2